MRRSIQLALKRSFDILGAGIGLLLLWPVLAVIAVCIKVESRGPIFFSQERVGFRGRPFRILKFRTMVENAEHIGSGLYVSRDDSRITRLGKTVRRFSLDELPQLAHIVTGKMSMVGPRPALPYHVER